MMTSFFNKKFERGSLALGLALLPWVALSTLVGCSSDAKPVTPPGTGGAGPTCAAPGGPESGPVDAHCDGDGGPIVQETGVCQMAMAAAGTDYGDPIYNTKGSDDDCKYDVSYTATPICENTGVTFMVTANKRTPDHSALTGAAPFVEANIGTHPGLTATETTIELKDGVYQIGPIEFDQPGEWTIRFHFFEDCADDPEDSPHGHIAFLVNVP
ncbi:MAG TPA: hypothetical protein VGI10_18720 [Polyangiaceae bacterium]